MNGRVILLGCAGLCAGAMMLLGCGSGTSAPPASCIPSDAIVAASDYASSEVGAVALDGGASFASGIDLGADPALAASRGRFFYLARDIGEVFELDPRCGRAVRSLSANDANTPGSSNPQDVAVAPDASLWVARFTVPAVLVLGKNGAPAGTLDLSSYDSDGNPNMSSVRILDGIGSPPSSKAFVALERLDDLRMLQSRQPSMMLRIDVATRAIDPPLTLAGRNPFGTMVEDGGFLWLAEPGNFDAANEPDAGIERVDPQALTSILVAREVDLGGSAVEVAVSGACGAAILADATAVNATSLVTFDPESGALLSPPGQPLLATSGYFLQAMAWTGDVLLVGEGDPQHPRASKVHVFDRTGTCDLHERALPLPFPLKPIALRPTPSR